MGVAIKYAGKFTNRSGMRQLVAVDPIPGAVRDWVFAGAVDGSTADVPDLVGGVPLKLINGAMVATNAAGRKVVRLDGVNDYVEDPTVGTVPQPFSLVIVAQLVGSVPSNRVLMTGTGGGGSTIGTSATDPLNYVTYSGTILNSGVAVDLQRHVIITRNQGATSLIRVDTTVKTGQAGASPMVGIRSGSTSGLVSPVRMDVERLALIPGGVTDARAAEIYALIK